MSKLKGIVLHHTAGPMTQTFEAINAYHKKIFNFKSELGQYIGYQYLITSDGKIHQGRKDTEMGAHTIGRNHDSIGIAITGWFDPGKDKLPNKAQQDSLAKLLVEKINQWGFSEKDITFHRDSSSKSCPGLNITKEWVFSLIKNYKNSMSNVSKEIKTWAEAREKNQGLSMKEDWWEYAFKQRANIKEIEEELKTIKETLKNKEQEWNIEKERLEKSIAGYSLTISSMKVKFDEENRLLQKELKTLRENEQEEQILRNQNEKNIEEKIKNLEEELNKYKRESEELKEKLVKERIGLFKEMSFFEKIDLIFRKK